MHYYFLYITISYISLFLMRYYFLHVIIFTRYYFKCVSYILLFLYIVIFMHYSFLYIIISYISLFPTRYYFHPLSSASYQTHRPLQYFPHIIISNTLSSVSYRTLAVFLTRYYFTHIIIFHALLFLIHYYFSHITLFLIISCI